MINGLVSVIIPVHPGAYLKFCLKALENSIYKNIEIIIVDEGLERSIQRNIGIARAQGEYYLFLDYDMLIDYRLIEDCVDKIRDCSALYIPEIIATHGLFGYLRNWERQFYNGTAIDAVRFIRAACCPLFDNDLTGPEDSDWDRRIVGLKGIAEYPFYHLDNIGMVKYFRKKAYYAKDMDKFKSKWPKDKILDFRWRCWRVFVENEKWKRFFSKPHFALAVLLLIFVRGIIYKCAKKY